MRSWVGTQIARSTLFIIIIVIVIIITIIIIYFNYFYLVYTDIDVETQKGGQYVNAVEIGFNSLFLVNALNP